MQYYNEEKMRNFRLRIEEEILSWPNVTTKKMYGCPCYKNKEKLFAFLVTDGVVLTKASEQDKIKLSKEFEIRPFQAGKRTMNKWPQINVDETTELEKIIPYVKNSYDQSQTSIEGT
jgi:predicted DNA-binding protein (MmcQ/YjbR family)